MSNFLSNIFEKVYDFLVPATPELYTAAERVIKRDAQRKNRIKLLSYEDAKVLIKRRLRDKRIFEVYSDVVLQVESLSVLPRQLEDLFAMCPHFYAHDSAIEVDYRKLTPLGRKRPFDPGAAQFSDGFYLVGEDPDSAEGGQLLVSISGDRCFCISDQYKLADLVANPHSGWPSVFHWMVSQERQDTYLD